MHNVLYSRKDQKFAQLLDEIHLTGLVANGSSLLFRQDLISFRRSDHFIFVGLYSIVLGLGPRPADAVLD